MGGLKRRLPPKSVPYKHLSRPAPGAAAARARFPAPWTARRVTSRTARRRCVPPPSTRRQQPSHVFGVTRCSRTLFLFSSARVPVGLQCFRPLTFDAPARVIQLEEFKRRKQAKGAALRSQFLGGGGGGDGVEDGPLDADGDGDGDSARDASAGLAPESYDGPSSPTRSDFSTTASESGRSKYQDRLNARLATVLGPRAGADAEAGLGAGANYDEVDADAFADATRLEERRVKALSAGEVLTKELASARADIASARDLTYGAAPATPGGGDAGFSPGKGFVENEHAARL